MPDERYQWDGTDEWWDNIWNHEYGHEYSDGWWAADSGSKWDNYAWWDGKSSLHQMNEKKRKDETEEKEENTKPKKEKKKTPTASPADSLPPEKPKKKREKKEIDEDEEKEPVAAPKRRCKGKAADDANSMPEAGKKFLGTPNKDKSQIRKYIAYFTQTDDSKKATEVTDTEKHAMKSKLFMHHFEESRLNIYWKKPGCGVTSHYQQKDVASFTFQGGVDTCYMVRLAASLKCAELFVTWAHEDLFTIKLTDDQIYFGIYAKSSKISLYSN